MDEGDVGLQATLNALDHAPPELAQDMLRAALAEPYPEIQRAAAEFLVRADRPVTARLLFSAFPSLAPEAKAVVVAHAYGLVGPLRAAVQDRDPSVRIAALRVLEALPDPEVGGIAVAALEDADPAIRERALAALRGVVTACLAPPPAGMEPAPVPPDPGALVSLLSQVLAQYERHRQPFFLETLLSMGDRGTGTLVQVLAGPPAPVRADLVMVLERTDTEDAAAFLLHLLRERSEGLHLAARALFRKKRTPEFARALARVAARLEGAPAAAALRFEDVPWWPCLGDHLEACEPADLVRVSALIVGSRLETSVKAAVLHDVLRAPTPEARRAALRHLRDLGAAALRPALEAVLADADAGVQMEAFEALRALNPPDKVKLLTPLLATPHEAVRRAAMAEISRESFERYLRSFDRLDAKTRELAGQAIAKLDPAMAGRLADEIRALDPERRIKALRIIEVVNKEQELEPALFDLIRDPDRRVRATAVHTVGLAGGVEAIKVLMRALGDPDRRVRANAVEAFEDLGDTRLADLLVPFLKDSDNRVRANAVKALWNLGRAEARPALEEMLASPDEKMRLSAAWTLGEIEVPGAEALLRQALVREGAVAVRNRIREVLERHGTVG